MKHKLISAGGARLPVDRQNSGQGSDMNSIKWGIAGKLIAIVIILTLLLSQRAWTDNSLRQLALSERRPRITPQDRLLTLSAEQVELMCARGEILRKVYPRLSPQSKKILLRPDILTVFLGIKPAYICYEDIDTIPFYDEILSFLEVRQNFGFLFLDNYIVDLAYFIERLKTEGWFLVNRGVMTKRDLQVITSNGINQQTVDIIVNLLNSYAGDIPGRTELHGFILGYSLDDIKYTAEWENTTPEQRPRINVVKSEYGFLVVSRSTDDAVNILRSWEAVLSWGYSLFEDQPDFREVMSQETLAAFRKITATTMLNPQPMLAIGVASAIGAIPEGATLQIQNGIEKQLQHAI